MDRKRGTSKQTKNCLLGRRKNCPKTFKLLIKNEIRISAFIDLDPKKIGRSNTEIPILSIDQLPPPDKCFCFYTRRIQGCP